MITVERSLLWLCSQKLAAVSADKVVHVFDETGDRKDKFKTKAADPSSSQNYVVRSMAFSPDSTKLALAQSDNIVFVYRLGLEWGEKKSICNKFQQSAPITAMVWPNSRDQELIFATADGKVHTMATRLTHWYTVAATAQLHTRLVALLHMPFFLDCVTLLCRSSWVC